MPLRKIDGNMERIIGTFTMALGLGALIPRSGFGLYLLLEQSGGRLIWSMGLLMIGSWTIIASYLSMPLFRAGLLLILVATWAMLLPMFYAAALWGATLQGVAVIYFSLLYGTKLVLVWRGR